MVTDSQEELRFALDLAERAGVMLAERFRSPEARKPGFKGRRNLVTATDRELEDFITAEISRAYPGHGILAEEAHAQDLESEWLWVIDPLDGTTNFVHGHPFVAVSIGLLHERKPFLGVVNAPMLGMLFDAVTGGGARLNGEFVSVSRTKEIADSLVATGFAYNRNDCNADNLDNFTRFASEARGIRRCGSAATDLCFVAAGIYDLFWELWLAPWDVAAGCVIVTEAGGRVSDLRGGDDYIFGKSIVASNGILHENARANLSGAGETAPNTD